MGLLLVLNKHRATPYCSACCIEQLGVRGALAREAGNQTPPGPPTRGPKGSLPTPPLCLWWRPLRSSTLILFRHFFSGLIARCGANRVTERERERLNATALWLAAKGERPPVRRGMRMKAMRFTVSSWCRMVSSSIRSYASTGSNASEFRRCLRKGFCVLYVWFIGEQVQRPHMATRGSVRGGGRSIKRWSFIWFIRHISCINQWRQFCIFLQMKIVSEKLARLFCVLQKDFVCNTCYLLASRCNDCTWPHGAVWGEVEGPSNAGLSRVERQVSVGFFVM